MLTQKDWDYTITNFFSGLDKFIEIAKDYDFNLTDKIPHSKASSFLRIIFLVSEHNAYHTGQIVQIRKALGD